MKTARVLVLPFLLLFSQCCYAAEVATQQLEHTLVRVKLDAGESAGVLSKEFTTIEHASVDGGIVWTAPPGRYAVIVSGGTAGMQILPVQIGRVDPPAPEPDPPNPPGPTPPKPDDVTPLPVVVPDAVLNKMGIGEVAYREALKIGDKSKVAGMAVYVAKIKNQVRGQGLTPTPAKAALRSVEGFKDWADACIAKAEAVANGRDGGGGTLSWSNYLLEMESGLLEAAK